MDETKVSQQQMTEWQLIYDGWDPDEQPLREALCTLGNGYFAARGAFEWCRAGGPHYPGTYLAGGYNRRQSEVSGRTIENEDLVNWPNWMYMSFRIEDGPWFDLEKVDLLEFQQVLDVQRGVLERHLRFRDQQGRESSLLSRRIVSMAEPHLAAIHWSFTPHNWSGRLEVTSEIDASVINSGVARYRALASEHLDVLERGQVIDDSVYVAVETNQSHIRMAQAARTRVLHGEKPVAAARETFEEGGRIWQVITLSCEENQAVEVEKVVALYTSRDRAISEPGLEACTLIQRAPSFEEMLDLHATYWSHYWRRCDISLANSLYAQLVLRLHIFHLLQTTSMSTVGLDVGVPARGLHGEAYRGHIFWDELFIFPFLNLRIPELTRSLLMYRYNRLGEARHAAAAEGQRGAMYPWQSGSNGREESQVLHLNPKSGRWVPDHTYRQRHINGAVAYNIWEYYQATHDMEFLSFYGAEMFLEIARFWASIAIHNPDRDRYEIHGVVGPDEFHTKYPDSDEVGLRNNAYTNVLACWVLVTAGRILEMLGQQRRTELMENLGIDEQEVALWDQVSRKMFIPFVDGGVMSQFEGWEDLEEFDWDGYRQTYRDIHRLDRILEKENKDVNSYKAAKQADVLMLFYLFTAEQLRALLEHMGYEFGPEMIPRTIDYYLRRTSHGSTLSGLVHSWVLSRSDRTRSWDLFQRALASDVEDIQGGTTSEGIHLGAMAGTVDLIQRCHTGVEIGEDILRLNPCLPDPLGEVTLRLRYRRHWLALTVSHERMTVLVEEGRGAAVTLGVGEEVFTLEPGESRTFELAPAKEEGCGPITSA